MAEKKIGKVTHFFNHLSVAAIEITEGELKVGDTIHIDGHTSDFLQKVNSMQIERESVEKVIVGQSIGIKVDEPVRQHDDVFLVTD